MSDTGGDNSKVPKIILWAPKGQMYQIYGKWNKDNINGMKYSSNCLKNVLKQNQNLKKNLEMWLPVFY